MGLAAIEINDAFLTLLAGEGGSVEPGFAAALNGTPSFGADAASLALTMPQHVSTRHWRDFDSTPLVRPLGVWRTRAEVAAAQLAALWKRTNASSSALLVAVPPHWSAEQAALFGQLARAEGITIAGMADGPLAACRHEYPGRDLFQLELTLHGLYVTRIRQTGEAAVAEREEFPSLGWVALHNLGLEAVSRCFITGSRFDPLHGPDSERALRAELPDWLARLSRGERVDAMLTTGGVRATAVLEADELKARFAAALEPLLQRLRASALARTAVALQLHAGLAGFPGVVDALARLPNTTVHLQEPGASARGLLARAEAVHGGNGTVRMSLPFDLPPVLDGATASAGVSAAAPTHLIFGDRAYRLGTRPLLVGTEAEGEEYAIVLGANHRGVSRRHCTVRLEGAVVSVVDHSRFGTLLNGYRLEGTAVLATGDRITLGTPPVELRLVAEADDRAP